MAQEPLYALNMHSKEIPLIEKVRAALCEVQASNAGAREKLIAAIYAFYTENYLLKDLVLSLVADPESKKKVMKWRSDIEDVLYAQAMHMGWISPRDGAGGWDAYKKPFKGLRQDGNLKIYITLSHGADLKKFYENANKLKYLMRYLNDAPTVGLVQMKIPQSFSGWVLHKDQVVIHYNNVNDYEAVWDAIKKSGIEPFERSLMHREENGVDEYTSDSMIISMGAADQLIQSMGTTKSCYDFTDEYLFNTLLTNMRSSTHRDRLYAYFRSK